MKGYNISKLSSSLKHLPYFQSLKPEDILRSIKLFESLPASLLKSIAPRAVIDNFNPGDLICRHGMFTEKFYLILSGTAKAIIPTEDNPRFELYSLRDGDFFGEEVVTSTEPRDNSILATSELFTLSLEHGDLNEIIIKSDTISTLLDHFYIDRKLRRDLRRIPIFNYLNDELFELVLKKVSLLSIDKNTVIFKEDDPGDAFYLIRKGEVKVFRHKNGEEHLISILGEGEFFGEMALLTDESRNATVITAEKTDLVSICDCDFYTIIEKDDRIKNDLQLVVEERREYGANAITDPNMPIISKSLMILNSDINRHLDIITQCAVDTESGSALLATLPGSRYPYVYPRDSACASRFLHMLSNSPLKSGDNAFRLLGEISRFIRSCQREDGYWGQRYGISGEDKGIYLQEDNVAHGVTILCRYLLAAHHRDIIIPELDLYLDAISKGSAFAQKNYYRNEIHLFYSTTSIHESAIEEGYSIWVNYAYLRMLQSIEEVARRYEITNRFKPETMLKHGFSATVDKVFSLSGRFVRRLKPDGEADLRPDITLLSPFFFTTGITDNPFHDNNTFNNAVTFIEETLWDPDLGMLQRYLPFIEDPDTHIHAGNGPWLQYTAMLAQYYFCIGKIDQGQSVMDKINSYISREGYLSEHLTTPERFEEFKNLEWKPGHDYEKEFEPKILIPNLSYDHIVEELNHMKKAYENIEDQIETLAPGGFITFATPLMWSHAEYAMAILMKSENELKKLNFSLL